MRINLDIKEKLSDKGNLIKRFELGWYDMAWLTLYPKNTKMLGNLEF